MAPRKTTKKKTTNRSQGGSLLGLILFATLTMIVGVAAGYCWRSFYPLALPFESPLVSDRTADDLETEDLRKVAAAARRRAEVAEAERERLKARVDELESVQQRTQRELGDMQIKAVLGAKAE